MTVKFRDYLNECLKDPEFRAEYEALKAEDEVIQAIIEARKASGLTEQGLAEKSGLRAEDITNLESGQSEPTLRLLLQLARGMGKQLRLEFLPV